MNVELLVVPFDTGVRGWRMGAGPEHLMRAGLEDRLRSAGRSVTSSVIVPARDGGAEIATAFELMANLATAVRGAIDAGRFPLVLAGNCNTASGTLLLGVRDVDPLEGELLRDSAVRVLSPAAIRAGDLDTALRRLRTEVDAAYVHCDLDVLDPAVGHANPFAVAGGLTVEELEGALRAIGAAVPVKAAALTAYAPESDPDGRIREAAFRVTDVLLDVAADPTGC